MSDEQTMPTALALVKARLGLTGSVRDEFLQVIVDGVMTELRDVQGLALSEANPHHLMFIVDLATWRYQNRDVPGTMPRHLQFRLHNLLLAPVVGDGDDV